MYSSLVLSIFTMLINRALEHFHLGKLKLYMFNNSPLSLLPGPGNHLSAFCMYEFDYF